MKKELIVFLIIIRAAGILDAQDFFTQNIITDLNTHPSGFAAYAPFSTLNRPNGYGSILGLRFFDGVGSDWRTQLAFGTDNNFYYRQSTNNAGNSWSSWYTIYHSGNLNRSDADFTANNLNLNGSLHLGSRSYITIPSGYPYIPEDWKRGSSGGIILAGSQYPDGSGWAYGSRLINHDYGNGLALSFDVLVGGNWYNDAFIISGRLGSIGNVGIGCTNPQNKLDVNGTIRAKEVKVTLDGWSDFVFAPTYKLKPLTEVEKYIKTNGHLENIPSAKEVKENGVIVGDMQAKLLEQVEQLTLYSIEQEKANSELKQKLANQEKECSEIKQEMKELKVLIINKLK